MNLKGSKVSSKWRSFKRIIYIGSADAYESQVLEFGRAQNEKEEDRTCFFDRYKDLIFLG